MTSSECLDAAVGLRHGIAELIEFCKAKEIEFTIVKAGLDFYIDHTIAKSGWTNVRRVSGTRSVTMGSR